MKIAGLIVGMAIATASALAAPISYPNPGVIAPTHVITATETGDVTATLYSALSASEDRISMIDLTTGTNSGDLLYSKSVPLGTVTNFGHVNEGDLILFRVKNDSAFDAAQVFTSDPAHSTDGYNHLYAYDLHNGLTFAGFEDIPQGQWWSGANYTDTELIFTNLTLSDPDFGEVAGSPVPEPSTLGLFGTGALGLAGLVRRRISA